MSFFLHACVGCQLLEPIYSLLVGSVVIKKVQARIIIAHHFINEIHFYTDQFILSRLRFHYIIVSMTAPRTIGYIQSNINREMIRVP